MFNRALNEIATEAVSACPLCNERRRNTLYKGLKDLLFGAPGEWTLNQCTGCGLVYLDPRPAMNDMDKAYTASYSHRKSAKPSNGLTLPEQLMSKVKSVIMLDYLTNSYGYKANPSLWKRMITFPFTASPYLREQAAYSVMKLPFTPGGRLLDIGCGVGKFIELMSDMGWKAEGLDTDPVVVQNCKGRGLSVREGTLEKQGYPDNYFDAITLKHVVEHVYDPVCLLKECHRILKPGGKLVLMTPNLESLGHKKFKQFWIGLDAPRHLFLFTAKTLSQAIQRAGLKLIHLSSTGRISEFNWLVSYHLKKYNKNVYFSKPDLLGRVMAKIYDKNVRLQILWDKMAGEELMFIVTKDSER